MSEEQIRQIVREESKRFEDRIIELEKENYKLNNILTELEDWLEIKEEKETIGTFQDVLDKIQELRNKYEK